MAKTDAITSDKFKIRGRLSFVKLDRPRPYEEGAVPRWECTTMLDSADAHGLESIKKLLSVAKDLAKQKWGVTPLALRKLAAEYIPGAPAVDGKEKDDKIELAFYNGDDKADEKPEIYESYRGHLIVPGHEYENRPKPVIVNRKGVSIDPGDDQWPYSGCYGVTSVTLWTYEGRGKRRISTNLRGVQFDKPGEAFSGEGQRNAADEFEALEDDPDQGTAANDWDD